MRCLVATRNAHKLREIREILDLPTLELVGADQAGGLPDVDEDGDTLEANAVKKAVTLALASGLWTLADDSGLEVPALDGAPGVRSARYAGEPPDYERNNAKLLGELRGCPRRTARFRCVIALASPSGDCRTVEGCCEGRIADACRGSKGFGYDPLFIPNGGSLTFAELAPDLKNSMSHRGRALRLALKEWGTLLGGSPPRR